jgi:hypothetical protein
MKALCLSAAVGGACALLALAPASALAQTATVGGVLSPPIPGPGNGSLFPTPIPPQTVARGARDGRHRGGFRNDVFFYEEPYTVHDVVVVHDQPAEPAAPPEPPPAPRERWVLGRTYGSLPGGCLKMISGGASYFQCSGNWYRELGAEQYKAVEMP